MTIINNPISFRSRIFQFNKLLGCLVFKERMNVVKDNTRTKVDNIIKQQCIDAVVNPFLMRKRPFRHNGIVINNKYLAKIYARFLTWLCSHCYPLAQLCSHLHFNVFENAGDAARFYYSVYPNEERQRVLCLPRAIFIATTSRRFKEHGVLFIGAFLPTVRMHAWVVEDGMCADIWDNQWFCFQPVMMIL